MESKTPTASVQAADLEIRAQQPSLASPAPNTKDAHDGGIHPQGSTDVPHSESARTPNITGSDQFHPEELIREEKISLLQRPRDSVPPADRVLDEHYKLSADDIADIKPGQWLSDKVVQTVLRRLTLLRPGKFYAIDVTSISTMAEILEGLPEDAREEFTRPVMTDVAMLTSTKGTVLVPFKVSGNHFILVAINVEKRAVYIYDSLTQSDENNTPDSDYFHELEEFAKKRVEWLLNFQHGEVTATRPELQCVPCPQQHNGVDCGVSVCLTALHLISYPESAWTFLRPQFSAEALGRQGRYAMHETYWLAGRRIILELCRPYADLSDNKVREALELTEAAIQSALEYLAEGFGRPRPEEAHYDAIAQVIRNAGIGGYVDQTFLQSLRAVEPIVRNARHNRHVLAAGVRCLNSDLVDLLNHVRELGTASTVSRDLAVQRQAAEAPALSEDWEEFRPEVVRKAVAYAWHDVGEIRKARDDLVRAATALLQVVQDFYLGPGRAVPPHTLECMMRNAASRPLPAPVAAGERGSSGVEERAERDTWSSWKDDTG